MEFDASYDVIKGSYCCKYETDSDASQDEMEAEKMSSKLKNMFKRKKVLKKSNHYEVAKVPNAYWEISAAHFQKAINLRPQSKSLTRSSSLTNIEDYDTGLGESFKSVGNLLTLDDAALDVDEEPKKEKRVRFAAFKQLISVVRHDVDIKILVLGDHYVGKSAIIRRFVHGIFEPNGQDARPNYEKKLMKLQNNEQFCLHIFEITGDIHSGIFTSATTTDAIGAIIVFDINDPQSFASIKKWKRELDIKARQAKLGQLPCILLANKCDAADTSFNMCELDSYCAKRGIVSWFDTSANTDFNLKNAFVYLMQKVLEEQKMFDSSAPTAAERKPKKLSFKLSFNKQNNQYEEECSTML